MVTKRKVRKFLEKQTVIDVFGINVEKIFIRQYCIGKCIPKSQHHKVKTYIKEILPQVKLEQLLKGE